jgi:hypothetical protein
MISIHYSKKKKTKRIKRKKRRQKKGAKKKLTCLVSFAPPTTKVKDELAELAAEVRSSNFKPETYLPSFLIFDDQKRKAAEVHDVNYINRHAFWPAKQTTYPHLFAAARILLLGPSNSMFCERMNSVARLVLTHLRSRLTSENKEHAILAYYHLREVSGRCAASTSPSRRLRRASRAMTLILSQGPGRPSRSLCRRWNYRATERVRGKKELK